MKKYFYINGFILVIIAALFIAFGRSFGVLFLSGVGILVGLAVNLHYLSFQKQSRIVKMLRNIVATGVLLFLLSFVIAEGMILSEVDSEPDRGEEIDYIVILGAGLRGSDISNMLRSRLEVAMEYASQNKSVPIIVSGGQGEGEDRTEAEAMGEYLVENGFDRERILFERKSTSTQENLAFTKELVRARGDYNPNLLIVTSNFHMKRAKMIARELGLANEGLASEVPPMVFVNYMAREYFAFVKDYMLMQKTDLAS